LVAISAGLFDRPYVFRTADGKRKILPIAFLYVYIRAVVFRIPMDCQQHCLFFELGGLFGVGPIRGRRALGFLFYGYCGLADRPCLL